MCEEEEEKQHRKSSIDIQNAKKLSSKIEVTRDFFFLFSQIMGGIDLRLLCPPGKSEVLEIISSSKLILIQQIHNEFVKSFCQS